MVKNINKARIRLDEFWPYQVTVLADMITRHTVALVKAHGDLNLSQWRVLAAIADNPGCTAAKVVSLTPMDKGIVSRATATLVENGLVRKQAVPTDKRRAELFLTEKGEDQYQRVSDAMLSALAPVLPSEAFNKRIKEVQSHFDRVTADQS